MRELKASTKAGQRVIAMGERCTAKSLYDLYSTCSQAKITAFNWCMSEFQKDETATAFGVGNANSFGFTASWVCVYKGVNCMRVETKDNSYIVFLDR